ncbi:DUF1350 family protein [Aerosakkonemataceae cyanobacterium BLCC-F50]|uniref:DUF1350 family protein n=1 Tax=Floridaenema flaviceps BLCC-F50 TaxID=3153642 RepID=A0ABV4XPW6_9CYAN
MQAVFKFQPISSSWVAIHPNPKGVVQFIGGAFFGTFPTLFYRYFLSQLFAEGYTIIALPFRFSFRHWPIAVSLLKEQEVISAELIAIAKKRGYEYNVYQKKSNYLWVAHSLGCKYVAMLEFLSDANWEQIVAKCVGNSRLNRIKNVVESIIGREKVSIKGQASLLIAPDISNTESAIPVPAIAKFLDDIGLGVKPTRKDTQCFIADSNLFNLTGLISFDKDTIAGNKNDINQSPKQQKESDVLWFIELLNSKNLPDDLQPLIREIPGKHLEPVGVKFGDYVVDLNPLDKFIELIKERWLERVAIQFLQELQEREKLL